MPKWMLTPPGDYDGPNTVHILNEIMYLGTYLGSWNKSKITWASSKGTLCLSASSPLVKKQSKGKFLFCKFL